MGDEWGQYKKDFALFQENSEVHFSVGCAPPS